jgi:predicted DNA-binding antitoxin AbrB/MazE fold protein
MKAKLKLKNGMILTVVIEKEDDKFLEGIDKFGDKVKLEKEDILSRVPIH